MWVGTAPKGHTWFLIPELHGTALGSKMCSQAEMLCYINYLLICSYFGTLVIYLFAKRFMRAIKRNEGGNKKYFSVYHVFWNCSFSFVVLRIYFNVLQ